VGSSNSSLVKVLEVGPTIEYLGGKEERRCLAFRPYSIGSDMRVWDKFITETDKQVFAAGGYGTRGTLGKCPVLLIVDVTYAFTGDIDEPILDSITKWHTSCGDRAWAAMPYIRQLIEAARAKNLPIFYSRGFDDRADGLASGLWRNSRVAEAAPASIPFGSQEIVREIGPELSDVVIQKAAPSVFFGTPFDAYLAALGADSIIICGTTTSGCVRATVVDAFSSGLRVVVAEEACFDRGEASHAIALFDLNAKYADILPTNEVVDYIHTVS
jgi:maleamate amidohydrolase